MALIKPFAALRPQPRLAAEICELPYDVLSSAEARKQAQGRPLSFFHVSKPEIDLPESTDPYSAAVYEKARENFATLIEQGALQHEEKPCFYLYRQIMGSHSQTGLVAAASCEAYLQGTIKKHELTRIDKEEDRIRHIETLNSQTGPVFLTYRADPAFDAFVVQKTSRKPDTDFKARDGVQHTTWTLRESTEIQMVENTFAKLSALYIADGHHRSAAAGRIFKKRKGAGDSGWFLSVIFPHNQMQILPYNRVLRNLNGLAPTQLLEKLETIFDMAPTTEPQPPAKHQLGFYFQNRWSRLTFKPALITSKDPIEQLDVTLLQKNVLAPLFGIDDPRTSKHIQFVGGIRGTGELEKLVNSGEFVCAFSMFPTGIEDLMSIADAGGIMPPKSTWFEPKLRDGLFSHMI